MPPHLYASKRNQCCIDGDCIEVKGMGSPKSILSLRLALFFFPLFFFLSFLRWGKVVVVWVDYL